MKNRCKECSKRVPVRNKQVNFACQREGLCLTCYLSASRQSGQAGENTYPPDRAIRAGLTDPSYTPRTLTGSLSENPERAECKECGKALPKGKSIISWTARTLGYCRYCYKMNFPRRPDKGKHLPMPGDVKTYGSYGAEVFNPDTPWEWYEAFMPERDR